MAKLYDEEGNLVEDVLTKDEYEAKLQEVQQLTEEEKAELEKLREKDLNFSKLKKKVESQPKEDPQPNEDPEPEENPELERMFTAVGVEDEAQKKLVKHYFEKLAGDIDDPALQMHYMEKAKALALSDKPLQGGEIPTSSAGGSTPPSGGGHQMTEADRFMRSKVFRIGGDTRHLEGKEWDPFQGIKNKQLPSPDSLKGTPGQNIPAANGSLTNNRE